jgi:hypothetical protein
MGGREGVRFSEPASDKKADTASKLAAVPIECASSGSSRARSPTGMPSKEALSEPSRELLLEKRGEGKRENPKREELLGANTSSSRSWRKRWHEKATKQETYY